MALSATGRRRLAGLVFLGIAVVLSIAGQTVLRSHLTGYGFLLYWFICLASLGLAVMTALLDLLVVRQAARREQQELLRQTFVQPRPDRATAHSAPVPVDVEDGSSVDSMAKPNGSGGSRGPAPNPPQSPRRREELI